jgi:hypothetical protein
LIFQQHHAAIREKPATIERSCDFLARRIAANIAKLLTRRRLNTGFR